MKPKMHDTLYESRLSLPSKARKPLTDRLGVILATLQDFRSQIYFAHWNLKGPNFIALHKHFDDLQDLVGEQIDEVAERIVALGGTAFGTIRQSSERSILEEMQQDGVTSMHFIPALADRCATLANECRSAIHDTDGLEDPATTDLLTQIGRELEKQLFLLTAHEG
jgi:starvation-inducible DNA-binding protein